MNPSPTHPSENEIDRANWLVRRAASRNVVVWQAARLALFGLAILATLAVVLYLTWHSDTVSFKAGQIADRTIKAPRTATFVSQIKTQERRQEAYDDARNVVLRSDPTVAPTQAAALQKALAEIDQVRAGAEPDRGRAIDRVRAAVDGLTADDAQAILALSDTSWTRVKDEASGLLDAALSGQVRTEDVAQVKERLVERASLSLSSSERGLAAALAKPFIRANVEVDEDKTKAAREAAASQVAPVEVTVQQGQVIVRDGDPVSKEDIEKLEYFGLLTPSENWHRYGGTVGLLAFITLALTLYLYRFTPEVWQGRQLLLLAIVLILPLVSERFLYQNPDLRYMLPTAAAAMLIAILLDFQLAVVVGAFLAFYLGVLANESYEVAAVAFPTAVAGAAVIWRAERTVTFFWSGLAVAVATYAGGMLFALLSGRLDAMRAGSLAADSAINGALSASLTFLSFSLLGRLFGITTHLQLLELAHPNQPLLYRLAREAPGTYHHSIVVSNLAESAIERVGGDPLFTRVAVLYHDIGKVLRPSFFVENQAGRSNVHDALDPRTSARIIQEHVLDGVRLARKARLPRAIIDVIQQHHGTTLIKYFYMQALQAGEDVDEVDFRYPGPKPQTREAGVIMLADGVEAAVRAAAQAGKLIESSGTNGHAQVSERLQEIVDGVIKARLEDGQLDECDLTLKHIEMVRQTFLSVLEGIYHPRIEYPEVRPPATPPPPADVAAAEVS